MKKLISLCSLLVCAQFGFGQKTETQYLSGTGSNDTKTWDFYCTGGRNSGHWTTIQVPSCWEQQGFGNYNYGRDYKTYGKNFRFADEKGMYKYRFSVPAGWRSRTVKIVFEASMTDTDVKINGKSVGKKHQGAFYEFEYDVSSLLNYNAPNLLEVTVSKMSEDASVNNAERLADYWIFGGIFRPVYLKALPVAHIEHVGIDAKADGKFATKIQLNTNHRNGKIKVDLFDKKNQKVATAEQKITSSDSVVELSSLVKNAKSWTSETPELYKAKYALFVGDKLVHQTEEKFGFRTIEIRKGDGIYINNVKVKMKGVNRHCFWPETARSLNDSIQLADALLIKGMNMNAVRCSHYPPDKRFLEICDSIGLYVLDELAGWQKWYSTEAGTPLVKEMVQRDENHPSIIFWDNGNEGGTNKALDHLFDDWDYSRRPVIHPHHRPGNSMNGIDCDHYEDYYSTLHKFQDTLIYMPTEFQHSQDDGGAASGMEDMWNLHWHAKNSGGGFIWALLDEGIARTDRNNQIDNNGLNANDGILGPHREKEASYFALKSIFNPIQIVSANKVFDGKIRIENRYHFTNANQCSVRWKLVNYANPFGDVAGYSIGDSGSFSLPDLLPLDSVVYQMPIAKTFDNYDAIVLDIVDPGSHILDQLIWKLKSNKAIINQTFNVNVAPKLDVAETDSTIMLTGGEVQLLFSKKTGMLSSVDNVSGNHFSFNNGPIATSGETVLKNYTITKGKDKTQLHFDFDGSLKSVDWTIDTAGIVDMDYQYALTGDYLFGGISFSYPENYILSTKWLGKGPYRQWKNRTAGTPVNVWDKMYNNTQTSYSPLIYPEFKGYYGETVWMEFNTVEGKFYVASPEDGMYVRLFDFYGLTGAKPYPALPRGDISFLRSIPPMGSKLALNLNTNTKNLGPKSELNHLNGNYKGHLVFYFGYPPMSKSGENYSRPKVDNVF